MDSGNYYGVASIVTAGLTTGIGCMMPALGEGKSVSSAFKFHCTATRCGTKPSPELYSWDWLWIESTAIYCFS